MKASLIARGLSGVCAVVLVACGGHAQGASTSRSTTSGATTTTATAGPRPAPAAATAAVRGDWLRFDFNAQRSGVGPASTGITSHNLGQLRLQKVAVNGTVDSSAIELHAITVKGHSRDVAIMTTTYGRTFALDARTGARLWEFTPSDIHSYEGSAQITTATPIADPDRRFVYASSPDGRIHKLRVANGREIRSGGWPTRVTLDATHEKIASALNISGGSVLVTTGGYIGDAPPYQGHVVTISRSTGRITGEWNSLCSNRHHLIKPSTCSASDSAIWGRAGAVVEPGTGRLLVTTGNAPFNGSTNWGDSVLELSANGRALLHNWTPANQAQLNAQDGDLGSTSPAVLPEFHGFRLAVQGGKDGVLRLLNLNRLDGTTAGAGAAAGRRAAAHPDARLRARVHGAGGVEARRADLRVPRRHVGHERLRAGRQAAAPARRVERLGVRNEPDRRRRAAVRVRSGGLSERLLADHGSQADLAAGRIRALEQPDRGRGTGDPASRQRQRSRDSRRRRHLPPSGALVAPFASDH